MFLNLSINVFGQVYIYTLQKNVKKWIMKGLPKKIPESEYLFPIYILTKETKITRGTNI